MICDEWGELCPKGLHEKVQSVCLECWAERLSHGSGDENMEKYDYRGIVHQPEGDEDQLLGVSSE